MRPRTDSRELLLEQFVILETDEWFFRLPFKMDLIQRAGRQIVEQDYFVIDSQSDAEKSVVILVDSRDYSGSQKKNSVCESVCEKFSKSDRRHIKSDKMWND